MDNALTVAGCAATLSEADAAAQIRGQYQAVVTAENNAFRQRVMLGGMLLQWENYLGISRGGRGTDGAGLKGWLETNVPELEYKSAVSYKDQAKKVIAILGGGQRAAAALMGHDTAVNPRGEVEAIDAEVISRRDDLFEHVDSRRKLDQQYFSFMADSLRGQAGRPAGSGGGGSDGSTALQRLTATSVTESCFSALTKLMALMVKNRGALMTRAGEIAARHPNECADFAALAHDYAAAFGR